MTDTVMSASIRANLLSLQNTTSIMDKTQLNLSTGKKVNSPLDNAVSFFAAKSLTDRAGDLNSLLDSMGQSISSINQASSGVSNLQKLVDQANSIAGQARDRIQRVETDAHLRVADRLHELCQSGGREGKVVLDRQRDPGGAQIGEKGAQQGSAVLDGRRASIRVQHDAQQARLDPFGDRQAAPQVRQRAAADAQLER